MNAEIYLIFIMSVKISVLRIFRFVNGWSIKVEKYNKRPMGPVSLTGFHLQNCLKVFAIPETLF